MILAEPFTCTVPTDDAVKHAEITCIGRAPDNYEYLGTVSDWCVVGLTILLVIGAFLAVRKAHQTLKQMRSDAQESREAERIIRETAAFDEYSKALFDACTSYPNDTDAQHVAWARTWAKYLPYLRIRNVDIARVARKANKHMRHVFIANSIANSSRNPKHYEYKDLDEAGKAVSDNLAPHALLITKVLSKWHTGEITTRKAVHRLAKIGADLKRLADDPVQFDEDEV